MNWTTKDGQLIPISKLSDEHLVNILRMLQDKAEDLRIVCDGSNWREFVHSSFNDLEIEAEKRNMKWDLFDGGPVVLDTRIKIKSPFERMVRGVIHQYLTHTSSIKFDDVGLLAKEIVAAIIKHNRSINEDNNVSS